MGSRTYHNPTAAPSRAPNWWDASIDVLFLIYPLVIALLIVTFACAGLFYAGSDAGWGIRPTFSNLAGTADTQISFPTCLYFSFVTVSTLGYGDYRPESYGRLVADLESLSGIILLGIFVSRLVTRRQDRLIARILRGQMNAEIQRFRQKIETLNLALPSLPAPICTLAQPSTFLYNLRGLLRAMARYWRHEFLEPSLPTVVPTSAMNRSLGEVRRLLESLTTQLTAQNIKAFHPRDKIYLHNIADSGRAIATLAKRLGDTGLTAAADKLEKAAAQLPR